MLSSRKMTVGMDSLSTLFDTEMDALAHSQRASLLGFYALLPIINLEPLDFLIGA
ncbi:hypothetical protein GCM10027342_27050 [Photobacterium alginatilyticum]